MHPSKDITRTKGNDLEGMRIALGVCGSVACVRSVELARELMRLGAHVSAVMTDAARELIHPNLLHWATGEPVVTRLTGGIEHVALAGNVSDKADLVLIAPATANTIGKIAAGIDDTPVTTLVTTAFGEGIPIVVVPAMHEPMYRHPIVNANIGKLTELDVTFVMPVVEEGKAKIAPNGEIIRAVGERLQGRQGARRESAGGGHVARGPQGATEASHGPSPHDEPAASITPDPGNDRSPHDTRRLRGKRFLVTAGRTVEYIDPVRVITNNSSGKMGMAVAEAFLDAGAEVTVVYGKGTAPPPAGARVVSVETSQEMLDTVLSEIESREYTGCVATAAVGDWKPREQAPEKITTHGTNSIALELVPTPKIIDQIKDRAPALFLVAFRALHDLPETDLVSNARQRMEKARADMIVVNDVSGAGRGFGADTNEVHILRKGVDAAEHIGLRSKREIGRILVDRITEALG